MESCTSGLIASMITDTEGASAIFRRIRYLSEWNKDSERCGCKRDWKYGVYSRECANAMAETAQKKLHTDIAIGITGTTGNVDPNNADSVQGQVYFCIREWGRRIIHMNWRLLCQKWTVMRLSRCMQIMYWKIGIVVEKRMIFAACYLEHVGFLVITWAI